MTDTQKQSSAKNTSKKIVSLTINPALIRRLDLYAAEKNISRSAAIEAAITLLLHSDLGTPAISMPSEECIFASAQLGTAIQF